VSYIKTKNLRASMSGFGAMGARTKMTARGYAVGAIPGLVDAGPLAELAQGVQAPANIQPSTSNPLNALRQAPTTPQSGGILDSLANLARGLFGGGQTSSPAATLPGAPTPYIPASKGMSTTTMLLIGGIAVGGVVLLTRKKG
jgi:hypothetical protein